MSTSDVDDYIAANAEGGEDDIDGDLEFANVHYFPAGGTVNGGRVAVGYQYAGSSYDWRFRHVPGKSSCIECHDPHSLEIDLVACGACHTGVTALEDLQEIRMISSVVADYDGDGDTSEGVGKSIEGLAYRLLAAIQDYPIEGATTLGSDICYDESASPFWFVDDNGNGVCDSGETTSYDSWTPRLVRAAYNYQLYQKDPGAYAHNPKYTIQLLYDALADLNTVNTTDTLGNSMRDDPSHFDGAAEAARSWDEGDGVDASCAKCHGGDEGFAFYVAYGVSIDTEEQGSGLECTVCHVNGATEAPGANALEVTRVIMPGGVEISADTLNPATVLVEVVLGVDNRNLLCATCHSGRESGITVDEAIDAGDLRFIDVHNLAAAAGYQAEYDHFNENDGASDHCVYCHSPAKSVHTFSVRDHFEENPAGNCGCHGNGDWDSLNFRVGGGATDFDGNPATTKLAEEVAAFAAKVLDAMQEHASNNVGVPICYDGAVSPYFFADNGYGGGTAHNDVCDGGEASYANRYTYWDAVLMRAGFNYQLSQKARGAWAHNYRYILQLLHDSIQATGGSLSGLTRPAVVDYRHN